MDDASAATTRNFQGIFANWPLSIDRQLPGFLFHRPGSHALDDRPPVEALG
jgi:hypothetical protein